MLKKILIGVGVLIVVLAAAGYFMYSRGYRLSPAEEVSLKNGNLEVSIAYCRPSVRDRLVFGTEEEGALQPYGKYWRLGANDATEITFNQDVLLVDQEVKKGSYVIYAIPGKNYFDLALNEEVGRWGATEVDHDLDVVTIKVPVIPSDHTEQFTVEIEKLYDNSMKAVFLWSDVKWELPIIANE